MGILQGDRHTVKRAPRPFSAERVIGLSSAPSRAILVEGHDGVQPRVVTLDLGEVRIHDLHRRDLPSSDRRCQLVRGSEDQIVHSPYLPHQRDSSTHQ